MAYMTSLITPKPVTDGNSSNQVKVKWQEKSDSPLGTNVYWIFFYKFVCWCLFYPVWKYSGLVCKTEFSIMLLLYTLISRDHEYLIPKTSQLTHLSWLFFIFKYLMTWLIHTHSSDIFLIFLQYRCFWWLYYRS